MSAQDKGKRETLVTASKQVGSIAGCKSQTSPVVPWVQAMSKQSIALHTSS